MPRIRSLKPEFFEDEDLAELHFWIRILYQGLWTLADREGRLEDRPIRIKAKIFPYDSVKVEDGLVALSGPKKHSPNHPPFIIRYEVNGEKYIQVLNFNQHQSPHSTEKESVIPPFNGEITVKEPLKNVDAVAPHYPETINHEQETINHKTVSAVVEFLNLKTGKNFSTKSKATIAHINARIAEGRTLDEFHHVITVKAHQWLNDPKMNAYLRPETLFGSKMEAYLNESIMLTPEEREKQVGASREKTPEQKAADRERDAKIKAFHRDMQNKWEPQIEAARTPEERNKLRASANTETQAGIKKIHGYEVQA